jgi:aspartate kinase
LIVAKIGGSCLGTKSDVRSVIQILKRIQEKPILVVSAFKGVTDELAIQARNALEGKADLEKIANLHRDFIQDLGFEVKAQIEDEVKVLFEEVQRLFQRIRCRKHLKPQDLDEVLSYGEKLATKIVASYLVQSGIDARALWDSNAGIVTNSNFGNASILDKSIYLIREKLETDFIPVIAGFFGRDEKGKVTTFGRGGSDYTATFIAAALHCEVVLFKDVQGLMTADPKIVRNTSMIKRMNYLDALEMARYGSKVIFEKAILPAMNAGIPIRIADFHRPTIGTTVSDQGSATVISSLPRVTRLGLRRHISTSSVWLKLLSDLSAHDVYPLLTRTAGRDFFLIVKETDSEIAQNMVRKIGGSNSISVDRELGVVAVVGIKSRKKGTVVVSRHLSEKEIVVDAMVRRRRSLCVIVNEKDVVKTTQALHDLFIETRSRRSLSPSQHGEDSSG